MRLKKMIGLVVMSISTVLTLAASQGIYAQASKEEVTISNRAQLDQWIEQAQASGITITKTIENKTVAQADVSLAVKQLKAYMLHRSKHYNKLSLNKNNMMMSILNH